MKIVRPESDASNLEIYNYFVNLDNNNFEEYLKKIGKFILYENKNKIQFTQTKEYIKLRYKFDKNRTKYYQYEGKYYWYIQKYVGYLLICQLEDDDILEILKKSRFIPNL